MVNESRPIKRDRRTRAEVEALCGALFEIVEEFKPMTVRQVFYQATSRDLIPKTEAGYRTVVRLLTRMRKADEMPYSWLADSTRWVRRAQTHSSMEEALWLTAETYRRSLWIGSDVSVEIWLEKEALAGVLTPVTEEWDVPLHVTRGYSSLSYLHAAAETIRNDRRRTQIYYFGDHDPSGLDIQGHIERALREMGAADFEVERVGVTPEQIEEWDLPMRPTKSSDSRSKGFEGGSVEVDAIHPDMLRQLAFEAIRRHVDVEQFNRLNQIEAAERETLAHFAEAFVDG